jgi:hypothetical protein
MSNVLKYQAKVNEKKDLAIKLSEVDREVSELAYECSVLQWGINIGDIVVDKKGVESKVCEIKPSWFSERSQTFTKPWLKGLRKKKDGEYGVKEYSLYDDWKKK